MFLSFKHRELDRCQGAERKRPPCDCPGRDARPAPRFRVRRNRHSPKKVEPELDWRPTVLACFAHFPSPRDVRVIIVTSPIRRAARAPRRRLQAPEPHAIRPFPSRRISTGMTPPDTNEISLPDELREKHQLCVRTLRANMHVCGFLKNSIRATERLPLDAAWTHQGSRPRELGQS
jgi:hypothetical protein